MGEHKKGITKEVIDQIYRILEKGNSCEIKQEKENIVVVEIYRKVRIKSENN